MATITDPAGRVIHEGDVVILLTGERDNEMFPVWGQSQGYVKGILDQIHVSSGKDSMVSVDWENGNSGIYNTQNNQFGVYDPSAAKSRVADVAKKAAAHRKQNAGGAGGPGGGNSMVPAPYAPFDAQSLANLQNVYQKPVLGGIAIQYAGSWDDDDDAEANKKIEEEKKLAHLDEAELEKLVVKPEVKADILAVLKQSKHRELIFDTWGLGDTIEYGKGQAMLFWGAPGTGKTWAANCIAKATGRELLVINAANIQTSEPGGANRNIEQAFTTAREKHNVLFLDECDSLITTRDDVGMILSSEINTLLTQIEKFEGICILATNRAESLDEALERRLALIIEFPEPDYEARKAIWGVLLPKKMPLGEKVSVDALAEFNLTGGQIKNVLLQAARNAAAAEAGKVELAHIESAVKRVQKATGLMGKKRNGAGSSGYKIVRG